MIKKIEDIKGEIENRIHEICENAKKELISERKKVEELNNSISEKQGFLDEIDNLILTIKENKVKLDKVDSEFENIKKDIRILKRETDRNVSGIQSNNTAIVILYIITGILFIIAIMT